MKLISKEGQTLVDVKSIQREGDDLVMKAKLMDAYSMPIYLSPVEVRNALKLLSWRLVCYLPLMLVRGSLQARRERKQAKAND
jgi:hypothetical protein